VGALLWNVGAGVERGHLDDFEIGGVDIAEIVEVGIVPTIIGSAAEYMEEPLSARMRPYF
jgi:hypothetical protein